MRADFQYINELVFDFVSQTPTIDSLQLIYEQEITGWEIWFQVEFSRFLANHHTEPVWDREIALEFDYRKEKEKYFFKPDFLIRKKGWKKESYAALEIKQHRQASVCVTNMLKDLEKVSKIRNSEIDLRTFWALGLFHTESTDDPWQLIVDKSQLAKVQITQSCSVVYEIPNTNFTYVLF